jgi:uncharacterized protein YbjQ (UPF0145 family)
MGLLGILFGRRPPALTPEQAAEQQRSQEQIEAGGLPVAAERRLRELAAGGEGFFTSDLSVNAFALLHREGIEPLTQVMGSSVYSLPRGNAVYPTAMSGYQAGHRVTEVASLTGVFNGARERALVRLRLEAELAGADAVVGVQMSSGGHAWSSGATTEFVAFGTAVRLPPALRTGAPVITDLTAQEYWQLAQAGCRPVGVVGISTVVYVSSSWQQNAVLTSSGRWGGAGAVNQELDEFTQGYALARTRAMRQVEERGRELGAHGIVGVRMTQDLTQMEWEDRSDSRRSDLVVSLHLLGTAITEGHAPLGSAGPLTILPLRQPASTT